MVSMFECDKPCKRDKVLSDDALQCSLDFRETWISGDECKNTKFTKSENYVSIV